MGTWDRVTYVNERQSPLAQVVPSLTSFVGQMLMMKMAQNFKKGESELNREHAETLALGKEKSTYDTKKEDKGDMPVTEGSGEDLSMFPHLAEAGMYTDKYGTSRLPAAEDELVENVDPKTGVKTSYVKDWEGNISNVSHRNPQQASAENQLIDRWMKANPGKNINDYLKEEIAGKEKVMAAGVDKRKGVASWAQSTKDTGEVFITPKYGDGTTGAPVSLGMIGKTKTVSETPEQKTDRSLDVDKRKRAQKNYEYALTSKGYTDAAAQVKKSTADTERGLQYFQDADLFEKDAMKAAGSNINVKKYYPEAQFGKDPKHGWVWAAPVTDPKTNIVTWYPVFTKDGMVPTQ